MNHSLEEIAEEIQMYLGVKAIVENKHIRVETIAGNLIYRQSEKTLMGDVYRFINHYGYKLAKYGLEMKLNINK
jgi:hypothetical protein